MFLILSMKPFSNWLEHTFRIHRWRGRFCSVVFCPIWTVYFPCGLVMTGWFSYGGTIGPLSLRPTAGDQLSCCCSAFLGEKTHDHRGRSDP